MTVEPISVNSSRAEWSDLSGNGDGDGDGKKVFDDTADTSGGALVPNGSPARGEDADSDDEESQCGLGVLSPRWLQPLASKQVFLVIFCITWVLQGMYYTYFVSVITTIEKLFRIQSKTTGIIMSATEMGQIGSSLLLTYYGGQGHRPKWIAWGMVLFSVSSFSCAVPHFIFGKTLIHANEVLYNGYANNTPKLTKCEVHENLPSFTPPPLERHPFEDSPSMVLRSTYLMMQATGSPPFADNVTLPHVHRNMTEVCRDDVLEEQRTQTKITKLVLSILFISLLGVGMGQTAVYTLGIPYIDDNVAARESPLYFAITIGVRILGPAGGFILGSLCTRLYADLSAVPKFLQTDPRWVGAWWLGLVIVSSMLMLSSFLMFSFPKKLKSYRVKKTYDRPSKNPSLKDFPMAVKRLLKNDILMFRTASSVLHILPIAGLYTFLPKYLESQFRLPAYTANMFAAVGGILVMGVGIIISGVFILKVKPNARSVAAWIAFTAVAYCIGMCVLMMIGCPQDDIAGLHELREGGDFSLACSSSCRCSDRFSPVCGSDGFTYFSACHAGCKEVNETDHTVNEFYDCLCINSGNSSYRNSLRLDPLPPSSHVGSLSTANIGFCALKCTSVLPYIVLFSLFAFIHSTSEVGSMLLILRCVDPRDKAMALGLIQFAIGLFGNVPCPIVYGAVVDYACLIWDNTCGKKGACWLYDATVFQNFYHGTTAVFLLCAFFADVVVWYKAGSINFDDDPPAEPEEELSPMRSAAETSV